MPVQLKTETNVTKWLTENGAEEYVDVFYDEGYYELDDLSDQAITDTVTKKGLAARLIRALALLRSKMDQPPAPEPPRRSGARDQTEVTKWLEKEKAPEYIDAFYDAGYESLADVSVEVVKEFVKLPGLAAHLIRALPKTTEPNAPQESLTLADIPPGTTLDLSAPTIETPDARFELPSSLSTDATFEAIVSPDSIKVEEWPIIARNSRLLFAFRMDGEKPESARRPALLWKVPRGKDFVSARHLEARVTSDLTYTEDSASYTRSGFNSQSARLALPFCAASVERSVRERQASTSFQKLLYMTGIWRYPRATLILDRCTAVNPAFVQAVTEALDSDDQLARLNEVFDEFGHAIPSEVLLGGQLYFQQKREAHGSVEVTEVENTIKAAVAAKVTPQVGSVAGSAGVSFQDGLAQKVTAQDIAESTSFEAYGGDTTLASNPASWAGTVKNPNLWTVIANDAIKSTTLLLSDKLQQRLKAVWDKVTPYQLALDGRVVSISAPAINPTRRVLGRAPNAGNQSTPHPVGMPDYVLSDPTARGVRWRLSFSGYYGDKNPLFWIELVGQDALLASSHSIRFDISSDVQHELLARNFQPLLTNTTLAGSATTDFAVLAPAALKSVPNATTDPDARRALWYVRPADPARYYGDTFTSAYFLEQFESHRVLSSQQNAGADIQDQDRIIGALEFRNPLLVEGIRSQLSIFRTNVSEFGVLVPLVFDRKTDARQLASYSWTLAPVEETDGPEAPMVDSPEMLARRDFYAQVRATIPTEPAAGAQIEENGGQQTWVYGRTYATSYATPIMVHQEPDFKADFRIGWREHTFRFGPDERYVIVAWEVISYRGDGTNGSWWKESEQILLTNSAAVHVKSQYDRGCHWGFRVYYVAAKDYAFLKNPFL